MLHCENIGLYPDSKEVVRSANFDVAKKAQAHRGEP